MRRKQLIPDELLSTPLAPPHAISGGRYEFCELVGHGILGLVYRGFDQELERQVAIKCIFDVGRPQIKSIAISDARALAAISHQNVIQIYDIVLDDDKVFIVTEWFEGNHLADLRLPADPYIAIAIMAQVYEGLAASHAVNLAHRGLCLDHLLVNNRGLIKIIGFGGTWSRMDQGLTASQGGRHESASVSGRDNHRSIADDLKAAASLLGSLSSDLDTHPAVAQILADRSARERGRHGSLAAANAAAELANLLATLTGYDPASYLATHLTNDIHRGAVDKRYTRGKRELREELRHQPLMVGNSPQLRAVYQLISRLAPVDVSTLIVGETGTGKELAARELHRLSGRADGPLVVVNAVALPADLIESELFGHKRGAFTGATTDRIGLIEQANGGTLFLDEIGELSPTAQAKLLRVLQERCFTRIGENTPRKSDFRLVTATHRNLTELIACGAFREDLYYRIAAATIEMPALRERREDIMLLADHFHRRFAHDHKLTRKRWSPAACRAMTAAAWPGNVRELAHAVRRAVVMTDGPTIMPQDLGLEPDHTPATATSTKADRLPTLEEAKTMWMRRFLKRALDSHNGRRTETAKALGIGERTLFRYIELFGIS